MWGMCPNLKLKVYIGTYMYCVRCCNNSQLQLDPGQMKHVSKPLTGKALMDSLGMGMQDKLKDIQDLDLHQAARALAS